MATLGFFAWAVKKTISDVYLQVEAGGFSVECRRVEGVDEVAEI